jgi:hypothetical protein
MPKQAIAEHRQYRPVTLCRARRKDAERPRHASGGPSTRGEFVQASEASTPRRVGRILVDLERVEHAHGKRTPLSRVWSNSRALSPFRLRVEAVLDARCKGVSMLRSFSLQPSSRSASESTSASCVLPRSCIVRHSDVQLKPYPHGALSMRGVVLQPIR